MKDLGYNTCLTAVLIGAIISLLIFHVIDDYNDLEEHTQAFSSGLQECIDQTSGYRLWQKECK